MGECGQRVQRVEVALKRAVIRLERPEGQQNAPADAVVPFDPVKDGVIFAPIRDAGIDPVLRDQAAGKAGKVELKDPLRAIRLDDLGVLSHAGKEPVDRCGGVALLDRFGLETLHELAESSAALGQGRGGKHRKSTQRGNQSKHIGPQSDFGAR